MIEKIAAALKIQAYKLFMAEDDLYIKKLDENLKSKLEFEISECVKNILNKN